MDFVIFFSFKSHGIYFSRRCRSLVVYVMLFNIRLYFISVKTFAEEEHLWVGG